MSGSQFTSGKGCRNRKLTDGDRLEIVRLYTTPLPNGTWMGATLIARRFGVRHAVIYRELERFGVPRRSAAESHSGGKACRPIVNLPVGDPSLCKCGCGEETLWNRRKKRWNRYAAGHYRPDRPYHDEAWLRQEYVDNRRTATEIGSDFGVSSHVIIRALRRAGIPRRSRSESRRGRRRGPLNHAWKGGVADWDYSPDWKAVARAIRRRDQWTCQGCGERRKRWGQALHVHHIDENKLNNDPGNLVSLCAACHYSAHKRGIPAPGR